MQTRYFDIENLPCKAYLPDCETASSAILAVHGFTGSKESPTIRLLAEAMCPEGAAVYCFDLPAHGTHPDGGKALTVSACENALMAVARHIAEMHEGPKGVFATSYGGYLALRCSEQLACALGTYALVLKAPAVKMAVTLEQRIIADQMPRFEQRGSIELGFGRMIDVQRAFLDELKAKDVCKPYEQPMLIIHGTEDALVEPADISDFTTRNPQAELVRIPGAGHEFAGEGQLDEVIRIAHAYLVRAFENNVSQP